MNKFLINSLLACSLTLTSFTSLINSKPIQAQSLKNSYKCIDKQGIPTTVVDTKRGRIELIIWQSDYFQASGWTPEKRCQEVSNRFQKFSDDGKLRYVTTGVINQQKVICVGKPFPGKGIQCIGDSLLITLQNDDNPDEILKSLFSNAAKVGGSPVTRDPVGKYVFPLSQYLETAPIMSQNESANINSAPSANPTQTNTNNDKNPTNCGILCE